MQLNMALFEFNGRTGYILKHDVLRRSDKKFDPFTDRIDTIIASTLTIKVLLVLIWNYKTKFLLQIVGGFCRFPEYVTFELIFLETIFRFTPVSSCRIRT